MILKWFIDIYNKKKSFIISVKSRRYNTRNKDFRDFDDIYILKISFKYIKY